MPTLLFYAVFTARKAELVIADSGTLNKVCIFEL